MIPDLFLKCSLLFLMLGMAVSCKDQEDLSSPVPDPPAAMYFPPLTGNTWESIPLSTLNWNTDKVDTLIRFLEATNTKAFILLKDGRIVLEEYFGTFTRDSLWYWASAGKSLTAFLTGIAQEKGFLSIADLTSDHLGTGWTSLSGPQEGLITIRHQLTMTSGLDDGAADPHCTAPECLKYKADAGTRWAYHNGPYTLLGDVIEAAVNQDYNAFTRSYVSNRIGMNGGWYRLGYNTIFFSNARSMARFGLLLASQGDWDGTVIMEDKDYFHDMINTSQTLNESYGYLFWLNGKNSFKIPVLRTTFTGSITPNAPADMYAAMGKNGQLINVVPGRGIVMVRMGDNPDDSLVPAAYQNQIWDLLSQVF